MSVVIVDTDVVSYLFKSHPIAFHYLSDLTDQTPMVSFMTVAELDRWALEARWGEPRRKRLSEYLERFAIFPYDRDLCGKWAEVTVAAQSCGRRIECADAWIAATALLCDAPLITHNRTDYLGVPGLTLISRAPL
ncbi:MAG: type II toxin-antitoxin system VapC family toxin [Bryobacteraceae bacterium]